MSRHKLSFTPLEILNICLVAFCKQNKALECVKMLLRQMDYGVNEKAVTCTLILKHTGPLKGPVCKMQVKL